MNKTQTYLRGVEKFFLDFLYEPLTFYTLLIALTICAILVLEAVYPDLVKWASSVGFLWLGDHYPVFTTADDREFSKGFVEWFGVFYGFFLPLLLIRAWEQLDTADREFDREADAIKVLLEDVTLLDDTDFFSLKQDMVNELDDYVHHVLAHYKEEHIQRDLRSYGDNLLQKLRANYKNLIYRGGGKRASRLEPLTTELLERLNEAIDIRGDRIAIFGQRLFETLRVIAIITSALWLIPFYFMSFQVGAFGSLLKLGVTVLIILVLGIIDDLDDPFSGTLRITETSWKEVQEEVTASLARLQESHDQRQAQKKICLFRFPRLRLGG